MVRFINEDVPNISMVLELPRYVSPLELGHNDYAARLQQFNEVFQQRIQDPLAVIIDWQKLRCALFTTGSDGRLEKGPVSGMEYVVLTKLESPQAEIRHLVEMLTHFRPELVERNAEVKNVTVDCMSLFENRSDRVYPMRMTDLAYLAGDQSLADEAKRVLVKEWIGADGKSILKRVKNRRKEYEVSSNTGAQRFNRETILQHYDLEEGIAYYNPTQQQSVWGFKAGPLRYVQFALMQELISFYRRIDDPTKNDLVVRLPANTGDKILSLEAENLLKISPMQVSELVHGYNYFLWLYHRAQEGYSRDRQTETVFDVNEVKDRLQTIDAILQGGILKGTKRELP